MLCHGNNKERERSRFSLALSQKRRVHLFFFSEQKKGAPRVLMRASTTRRQVALGRRGAFDIYIQNIYTSNTSPLSPYFSIFLFFFIRLETKRNRRAISSLRSATSAAAREKTKDARNAPPRREYGRCSFVSLRSMQIAPRRQIERECDPGSPTAARRGERSRAGASIFFFLSH